MRSLVFMPDSRPSTLNALFDATEFTDMVKGDFLAQGSADALARPAPDRGEYVPPKGVQQQPKGPPAEARGPFVYLTTSLSRGGAGGCSVARCWPATGSTGQLAAGCRSW